MANVPGEPSRQDKTLALFLLCLVEVLAMTVWFSASAVVPQLQLAWGLDGAAAAWLTMSVQLGFVVGGLTSAFLNLPDRFPSQTVFAFSAAGAALLNASIVAFPESHTWAYFARFATGAMLAGVYPPGMKLVATWTKRDRGLGLGLLVGAITVGSALPHLANAIPMFGQSGMPPWPTVILASSACALASAVIAAIAVRPGPHLARAARFNRRILTSVWKHRPTRYANLGYLGHMWELYAMWVWVPLALVAVYETAGWSIAAGRIAGFSVIAIGALGSILAGIVSDRVGRTTVTTVCLAASGFCCLIAGLTVGSPVAFTALALVWGVFVVADSAQFSTAITELGDPEYTGTALTLQTSLGFLLTMISIRIIPPAVEHFGWEWAFVPLAAGPAVGIWAMLALRRHPEAVKMASGNR